jgi:Ca2+-binding EF-hand superfamily protein
VTVTRFHILACAGIAISAMASAQNAPKPVARADYIKAVDDHFNGADANHDGFISRAELVAQQQRDLEAAKGRINQQLQIRFNQLDTNHDGKLSLQEFMGVTPALKVNETPEQMLARLDSNHDGKISAAEFRDPELAKFNKIDANHDGVVSVQELQGAAGRK